MKLTNDKPNLLTFVSSFSYRAHALEYLSTLRTAFTWLRRSIRCRYLIKAEGGSDYESDPSLRWTSSWLLEATSPGCQAFSPLYQSGFPAAVNNTFLSFPSQTVAESVLIACRRLL